MKPQIKQELIAIVGETNFSNQLIDLVSASYDASEHSHRPEAVVWPRSTAEVSNIMKLAGRHRIPVTPRGAGTGLTGAALPRHGGLLLDLCRMNRILDIRLQDRQARVQAGVVYADLQKKLKPHGFFYPPDPASGKAATLGGNVATNAGGLKGAKYGVTKHYLLGLEVVLADGSILKTGSNCLKCASGYDLTSLFVGSEGTLGVITEITLKVLPEPLEKATCLVTFSDLDLAGIAIAQVMASRAVPCVLDVLDEICVRSLNEHTDLGLPEAALLLLVETDGFTKGEADTQLDLIIDVFRTHQAKEIIKAASPEEAERMWTARRSVAGLIFGIKGALLAEDVTVPPSRLSELMRGVHAVGKKYNLMIACNGHVGDGNLHPNLLFDKFDPEESERAKQAAGELFQLAVDLGGTLSGEHGIGLAKAPYFSLEHDEVSIGVMRGIKKTLDPDNILNPSKMWE